MSNLPQMEPNVRCIEVSCNFEAVHHYPNAPDEVAFLRHPHRHIFHVKTRIEIFHDDRDLEFILVKRAIQKFISDNLSELNHMSCEMIANTIAWFVHNEYCQNRRRRIRISVFEDNENGAVMYY